MSATDRLDQIEARANILTEVEPGALISEENLLIDRDVPALVAALRAVLEHADRWATQSTDYDEDTEQQIDDGKVIVRAIEEALR